MAKKQILFVDDEPLVLNALERMLREKKSDWDMVFVSSGQEALSWLNNGQCDVIVSDMRMPGMDGAELLNQARNQYPEIVRIILSGHTDDEAIVRLALPAHLYLTKPCEKTILISTIDRECALRGSLRNESIRRVITKIGSLPVLPSLYAQIMNELESPNASIAKVAEIVSHDMGMTVKVLQLVNSAFFALRQRVASPLEAVRLLGLDIIKTLALSIDIFSRFEEDKEIILDINQVWKHSLRVAVFAKTLAGIEKQSRVIIYDSFMAGTLHDVGKLVLASNFPQEYRQILEIVGKEGCSAAEAEDRILEGVTHADIGGYLMGLWGLPDPIVEAIAFHHKQNSSLMESFTAPFGVFMANILDHGEDALFPDAPFVRSRLPVWQEECQKILEEGEHGI